MKEEKKIIMNTHIQDLKILMQIIMDSNKQF